MDPVKRLTGLLAAVLALLAISTGAAAAQNRPDVPPPSTGPTFSQSEAEGGYDFDGTLEDCKESMSIDTNVDIFDDIVNSKTAELCFGVAGVGTVTEGATTAAGWVIEKSAFWSDPIGKFTKAVMEGSTSAFGLVMTFWMSVPIPSLTDSTAITGIRNLTWEIQIVALAFGIGTAAIRVAIARRHAVAEGADETARMLFRTLFSIWTLPALVILLHRVGDSFSIWVIQQAADGDPTQKVTAIAWIDDKTGLGPVVSLVLAGVALFGSVAQLIALLIREAVLAIAVAVSPIAAAASATGTGRQTWSSLIGYTVSALLFKPVASLLYAFAFWAASSNTATDAVVGAVLLAIAGVSMPALVRVITPAAASISAGGGQLSAVAAGYGAGAGSRTPSSGSGSGGSTPATGAGLGSGSSTASSGSTSAGSPPASGAVQSSAGRSGGGAGSSASRSSASNAGGAAAARAGARGVAAGLGSVAGGVGAVAGSAAAAVRMVGRPAARLSSFAEGAIGNYHGQVPR
ncbi:hypothetical protein [Nocardia asiatica]|uniref:hypothetical protein n=1 Tax=Nocardia asiatica TaxID=209252 RepID=UPI0002F9F943|nr:hypothetical protein [Nocardia asiatica]